MQNQVIKVQTNESIISKLKNAFTSPGCVLSEAMQNARRAGASKVEFSYLDEDALLIVDDGQGIRDLADFLTLAGSGWSEEVIQKEGAFGMGSFSMLYYCDRLRVESNGYGFEAYTQDILNGLEISVFQSEVTSGTRIALYGYEISDENNASRIELLLKCLAKGFSIPVFYDGAELDRPYSLDKGEVEFIETSIGFCAMSDFDDDTLIGKSGLYYRDYGTDVTYLFYQGLPVDSIWGREESNRVRPGNIIHLDELQFDVRMPDRDVLIDQAVQSGKIETVLKELWRKKFIELKGMLEPAMFASKFQRALKSWECLDLLNNMDVLPDGVLFTVSSLPENDSYSRDDYTSSVNGMTRQKLESIGQKIVFFNNDHGYDYFRPHQYAHHREALCADMGSLSMLHKDHWIHEWLFEIEEEDLTLTVNKPGKEGHYSGYGCFDYQTCESLVINGPMGEVTVQNDCFAVNEDFMFIPSGALNGSNIRIICNYIDSNDQFDESGCNYDIEQFQALLYSLNQSVEMGVLSMLRTSGLSQFSLQGRQLQVTFNENGVPEKVTLSELDNAA